jgi:hypothetical protein
MAAWALATPLALSVVFEVAFSLRIPGGRPECRPQRYRQSGRSRGARRIAGGSPIRGRDPRRAESQNGKAGRPAHRYRFTSQSTPTRI